MDINFLQNLNRNDKDKNNLRFNNDLDDNLLSNPSKNNYIMNKSYNKSNLSKNTFNDFNDSLLELPNRRSRSNNCYIKNDYPYIYEDKNNNLFGYNQFLLEYDIKPEMIDDRQNYFFQYNKHPKNFLTDNFNVLNLNRNNICYKANICILQNKKINEFHQKNDENHFVFSNVNKSDEDHQEIFTLNNNTSQFQDDFFNKEKPESQMNTENKKSKVIGCGSTFKKYFIVNQTKTNESNNKKLQKTKRRTKMKFKNKEKVQEKYKNKSFKCLSNGCE